LYHIILLSLLLTVSLAVWNLVHSSPRSLAMLLPPGLTFVIGTFFLVVGTFLAFAGAYVQLGEVMVGSVIKAYVGVWFLTTHLRGDEEAIRRVFLMMGIMLVAIVGVFYAQDPRLNAMLLLMLTAAGYWLTTSFLRSLDRGR
jgi:hypothetical protein